MFKPEMVKAIIEGRKTQTRRVVKPQPHEVRIHGGDWLCDDGRILRCPFGMIGDVLYVKERWTSFRKRTENEQAKLSKILDDFRAGRVKDIVAAAMSMPTGTGEQEFMYAADFGEYADNPDADFHWQSSLLMPRHASRLRLELTDVRIERLHDIGKDGRKAQNVLAEGISPAEIEHERKWFHPDDSPALAFSRLWDSINGKKYPWASNPWVWVITFKPLEAA